MDAAEARGEAVDRLGDDLANTADHNRRHNGTLNKAYNMVAAVAVGQVGKGDKEDKSKTDFLNTGTVVDLYELEGDEETGADNLIEVKVPSPMGKSSHQKGVGSKKNGGTYASVGHRYAFGNTHERYRMLILGTRRRGRKRDGPLNHKTGRGWVRYRTGAYEDGMQKGARVTVLLTESTGAVSFDALKYVAYLSRRARGRKSRDSTSYGRSNTSATHFYTHHVQRLSMAAAIGDVKAIHENLTGLKQLACGAVGVSSP